MKHPKLSLVELTAPSHWASYLINGDASGLDDGELASVDSWLLANELPMPVSCEDDGFRWHHDASQFALASDCQRYAFLVESI